MGRRFFAFGTPPFQVIAEHLAKDEDFSHDVNRLLHISDDDLAALTRALVTSESFLDRKGLFALVDRFLGASENSTHIARIIWRLNEILRDADEPLEKAVGTLKQCISEFCTQIADGDRREAGERIEKLVVAPPALTRQHKAQRLAGATGAELEDIQIICDIRPVFNEERSQIEDAIPITMLRLDTIGLDGEGATIEIRLTEEQLTELCMKAELAKSKVSVIKKTLADKCITMPFTSATIDEREAK
jgi:hypothetical protein